ncbi:MAG: imidazole glycerol phosphate synthase subunit HisH [Planctomycetota bacterium]
MAATIAILDYGLANLRSVQKAFVHVGHDAEIVSDPKAASQASHVVLPGVGAVGDALRNLRDTGLAEVVVNHVAADRPMLGICLGLQMLFEVCHEGGEHHGLGLLRGEVRRFDVDRTQGLAVPHMGWNRLAVRNPSPVTPPEFEGQAVYFVHAYHAVCTDASDVATTTDYGGDFVSSVCRGNLVATQFHPEKSQSVGLAMLDRFARM